MDPLSLDPSNPFSPLSPVHPLNTETTATTREPQGIKIDLTMNGFTWVLLLTVALLLAGVWWKRWRAYRQARRELREEWLKLKSEIEAKKKKPECQSCSRFISCSMAQVEVCPLLVCEHCGHYPCGCGG